MTNAVRPNVFIWALVAAHAPVVFGARSLRAAPAHPVAPDPEVLGANGSALAYVPPEPRAILASRAAGDTPDLKELARPADRERLARVSHSGSPGEGGGDMVPRTHVHGDQTPSTMHWTYAAPEDWGNAWTDCTGDGQSPIDIESGDVLIDEEHQNVDYFAKHARYVELRDREIVNNGHNLQVNGMFGNITLPDGEYEVKQFHFHFPSEHEVNGQLATGELQIVHQKVGSEGVSNLAVVAILLQDERLQPPGMDHKHELDFMSGLGFGEELPEHDPKGNSSLRVAKPVDLNKFGQVLGQGFWHYRGSLTTPPCAETVHWYVLQQPATVTEAMASHFKKLLPAPSNNRPVQRIGSRHVVFSEVNLPGEFHAPRSLAFRPGSLGALAFLVLRALL